MITITTSTDKLINQKSDCLAFLLEQDYSFSGQLEQVAQHYLPQLKTVLEKYHFTGAVGTSLEIPVAHGNHISYLVFVGIGKKEPRKYINMELYRRAVGRVIRLIERHKHKSLALLLPSEKLFGVTEHILAQQTTEIIYMAEYRFDEYITDIERKSDRTFSVTFVVEDASKRAINKGIEIGTIVGTAVNHARQWIDLPAKYLTPTDLSHKARTIAKSHDMKCHVFSEETIDKMGMGGLAAVSKGSDQDAQLAIIEYSCGKKSAPTIALVGKGITFDSGGLSLKPAASMETMKEDMSGAAAVLATMDVIGKLKPKINIIGITPLSENLPSGKATKPGDIIRFYNGKTAEVKNTDAEGRLILADALSYAVKHYELDAIIDIATLTGACARAVGPYFTGMMSQNEELIERFNASAERSGDRVWRLPLTDDYMPAIKSHVADICNIGNEKYMAGASTAALFLKHFVNDVPWLHLDIASTAFDVPDISYFRPHTATGVGVRLFVDLIMNW